MIPMLAHFPRLWPLFPILLGVGAGALLVASLGSGGGGGKKKAKIAALKARVEALERKP
jgi:hypothetical protein